jgi:hypothetical protein
MATSLRGSENKVSIVAAASLDEAGHPIHLKVGKIETFCFEALADWAQDALARCTAWLERLLREQRPVEWCNSGGTAPA